jgi:hypothetical protein
VEILLDTLTVYVGVVIAVVLFGSDERSKRAERVLHALLNVFSRNGAGK